MRPVLFDLHLFGWDIALPTYGLILAISFLAALWVALRQARRGGVDPGAITDLWIASLLSGVVGAKLLLYILEIDYYMSHPRAILTSLRSAGVFYGGLILAIVVCLIMIRRRGMNAWLMGDVLAPAIILGQALGRWGCFAAGCCYGTPASVPWAVTFTDPRAREITGVPLDVALHPAQLYLSAADFVIFLILLGVASRKRFKGQVLLSYLILYPLARGTLEYFRGDPRGEIFAMSTSQFISIIVGVAGLILYLWKRSHSAAAPKGPRPPSKGRRKTAAAR